jgi:glutamyl-tRNA synthetase
MMGADGSKMSKRHGAVAVEEYKQKGFLPEALVNYLMLLGWSPREDREILDLKEAVSLFDLGDRNDTQVRFDVKKLTWLNGEHMMRKSMEELFPLIKEDLKKNSVDLSGVSDPYIRKILDLYKIRIKTIPEFFELTDAFFKDDYTIEEKGKRKYLDKDENKENLKIFAEKLENISDFTHENIEAVCREIADERGLKASGIIHPTRMAVSGKTRGAGLFEMMEVLGKTKVIERMKKAAI